MAYSNVNSFRPDVVKIKVIKKKACTRADSGGIE
jgi:hypothetical protein